MKIQKWLLYIDWNVWSTICRFDFIHERFLWLSFRQSFARVCCDAWEVISLAAAVRTNRYDFPIKTFSRLTSEWTLQRRAGLDRPWSEGLDRPCRRGLDRPWREGLDRPRVKD